MNGYGESLPTGAGGRPRVGTEAAVAAGVPSAVAPGRAFLRRLGGRIGAFLGFTTFLGGGLSLGGGVTRFLSGGFSTFSTFFSTFGGTTLYCSGSVSCCSWRLSIRPVGERR